MDKTFDDIKIDANSAKKYERDDLVVVCIDDKLNVGRMCKQGLINDIACYGITFVILLDLPLSMWNNDMYRLQEHDSREYIHVAMDVVGKCEALWICVAMVTLIIVAVVNDNGVVGIDYPGKFETKQCDIANYDAKIGEKIDFKHDGKQERGVLKWKGTIDGYRCVGIDPVRLLAALSHYCPLTNCSCRIPPNWFRIIARSSRSLIHIGSLFASM